MTRADHSSSIYDEKDSFIDGGAACGWILKFLNITDKKTENPLSVYYAGDTGVFSDMKLINEFHKPHYLILPIGG